MGVFAENEIYNHMNTVHGSIHGDGGVPPALAGVDYHEQQEVLRQAQLRRQPDVERQPLNLQPHRYFIGFDYHEQQEVLRQAQLLRQQRATMEENARRAVAEEQMRHQRARMLEEEQRVRFANYEREMERMRVHRRHDIEPGRWWARHIQLLPPVNDFQKG